jgi:hypothetical protein
LEEDKWRGREESRPVEADARTVFQEWQCEVASRKDLPRIIG